MRMERARHNRTTTNLATSEGYYNALKFGNYCVCSGDNYLNTPSDLARWCFVDYVFLFGTVDYRSSQVVIYRRKFGRQALLKSKGNV